MKIIDFPGAAGAGRDTRDLPIDPAPRVHTVPRDYWPRARPPVSNALWDAEYMLAMAERGAYPSAAGGRGEAAQQARRDEIAYWRARMDAHDALDEDHDARPVIEE